MARLLCLLKNRLTIPCPLYTWDVLRWDNVNQSMGVSSFVAEGTFVHVMS